MKYLILSFMVLLAGCDTPTRSRFPTSSSSSLGTPTTGSGFTSSTSGSASGGTTTGGATSDPGFEYCNLTNRSATADLGSVGICKSSLDETQIRFVSNMTNTTSRTCLIPTYKDQYGSSTYLGDPQCTYTQSEQVYTGRLYKNRSGFTNYAINGVMVMREGLLPEYFQCMDAYQQYINYYCPANQTYAPCVQGATNYRNSICNNFKQKYPNNYLDLNLR